MMLFFAFSFLQQLPRGHQRRILCWGAAGTTDGAFDDSSRYCAPTPGSRCRRWALRRRRRWRWWRWRRWRRRVRRWWWRGRRDRRAQLLVLVRRNGGGGRGRRGRRRGRYGRRARRAAGPLCRGRRRRTPVRRGRGGCGRRRRARRRRSRGRGPPHRRTARSTTQHSERARPPAEPARPEPPLTLNNITTF